MLGRMRRHGNIAAAAGVLLLCAMASGCVQGFGWLHRDHTLVKPRETAANRATPGENGNPQGTPDVRYANFQDAKPIPPEAPILPARGGPMSGKPPAPEEVPLPHGVPAERPSANAETAKTAIPPTAGSRKLITLHVDDLDVRKALEILSRQTNLSILVSPGVSGNVTLDLRDKTAEEILQAIARLCQLRIQHVGDMIFVTALSESKEGEDGKLPVRVYHLDYAKSSDVMRR